MYDRTIIMGRLGRDPEMRYTADGKPVCNLNVAVDRYAGPDRPKVTKWFRVAIWERGAEAANNHLHKGDTVLVEGNIEASAYMSAGEARASLELRASRVVFGPKAGSGDMAGVASAESVLNEEEIPF